MQDNDESAIVDTTAGVDSALRHRAMLTMLSAYTLLDVNKLAKDNDVSAHELADALPSSVAESTVAATLELLFEVDSVSSFIVSGTRVINTVLAGIATLTGASLIPREQVTALLTYLADYCDTEDGSVAEAVANRNYIAAADAIDETAVRRNARFIAAFLNDDTGYGASAAEALGQALADDDSDDDDESGEDEEADTPTEPVKLHG